MHELAFGVVVCQGWAEIKSLNIIAERLRTNIVRKHNEEEPIQQQEGARAGINASVYLASMQPTYKHIK